MDYTPILRADALDDDLDEEPKFATGGIVRVTDSDHSDSVPLIIQAHTAFEPYENGEGGWSFRRVVVP